MWRAVVVGLNTPGDIEPALPVPESAVLAGVGGPFVQGKSNCLDEFERQLNYGTGDQDLVAVHRPSEVPSG